MSEIKKFPDIVKADYYHFYIKIEAVDKHNNYIERNRKKKIEKPIVFVMPDVTLSRYMLKSSYPGLVIKRDLDKADTIIIDKEYLRYNDSYNILKGDYIIDEHRNQNDVYSLNLLENIDKDCFYYFYPCYDGRWRHRVQLNMNNFDCFNYDKDVDIVMVDDINLGTSRVIELEDIERIKQLLNGNFENSQLALSLLCNYNYDESKYLIAYFLGTNLDVFNSINSAKKNIEGKTFLKKLYTEFPIHNPYSDYVRLRNIGLILAKSIGTRYYEYIKTQSIGFMKGVLEPIVIKLENVLEINISINEKTNKEQESNIVQEYSV